MFTGKCFVFEGGARFEEKGGDILTMKAGGESLAEEVEGGGGRTAGYGFVVVECADDGGIRGKRDHFECLEGAVDPGIEVGLDAFFEFHQTAGEGVKTGG